MLPFAFSMSHFLRSTPRLMLNCASREPALRGPLKAPHLTAELISDSGTITRRTKSRVALSLTLEPGWHVYWGYAGDAGEPPAVMWSLPHGVAVGPMQYPAPLVVPLAR